MQVAAHAQLGTAFILQMSASIGREVGGLVGAGSAVAHELAALAKRANDLAVEMPNDERCRIWKVCDVPASVSQQRCCSRVYRPANQPSIS